MGIPGIVVDFALGDSQDEVLWTAFTRFLEASGLHGPQLITSGASIGLKFEMAAVCGRGLDRVAQLPRALSEQNRCQVHKGSIEMVVAAVRSSFAQPNSEQLRD